LYIREDTLEMATRVAKILAKRTRRPAYVGCSVNFSSAGRGGNVDEELEGIRGVVEAVVKKVEEAGVMEGIGGMKIR